MKVSIITVIPNNQVSIAHAINSVLNQDYCSIEYIVIDGSSIDATAKIIKSYGNRISRFISKPDQGIYDAINRGLKIAIGDIISVLNLDDFYKNTNVIYRIVQKFYFDKVDLVFGDIVFVNHQNLQQEIRYLL